MVANEKRSLEEQFRDVISSMGDEELAAITSDSMVANEKRSLEEQFHDVTIDAVTLAVNCINETIDENDVCIGPVGLAALVSMTLALEEDGGAISQEAIELGHVHYKKIRELMKNNK